MSPASLRLRLADGSRHRLPVALIQELQAKHRRKIKAIDPAIVLAALSQQEGARETTGEATLMCSHPSCVDVPAILTLCVSVIGGTGRGVVFMCEPCARKAYLAGGGELDHVGYGISAVIPGRADRWEREAKFNLNRRCPWQKSYQQTH